MASPIHQLLLMDVAASGPTAKSLDGSASTQASSVSSSTVTLSTTKTNDILVLQITAEGATGAALSASSVTSTSSLTWHPRGQVQAGPATMQGGANNYLDIETWWALAPSPLTNEVVTVNMSHSIDDMTLIVFGVNGCNTSSPWDTNVSLPAYQNNGSNGTASAPTVSGVSTTSTAPLMLGCLGSVNPASPSPPSGWTNIQTKNNGGGSLFCYSRADYDLLSSAQSSVTFTWGSSVSYFCLIVDALA